MSIFKQKVSFSSKFGSLSSVMRDNSSVLFQLKLYMVLKNYHVKVQIVRFATARIKIHRFSHVVFGTKSQFFFKLLHHSSVSLPFCTFPSKSLYTLYKRGSSKCKFQKLLTARMEINQTPYVIFQARTQFSFKFCITLQCRNT